MPDQSAFDLLREETIPEINSTGRLYRHRKTGAELLSLVNDDENKVFGVTFRTPPSDSTGVAHILEHSVLCGSRKYPLRKPFVELLKGSMHTFLNAMTFSDKTAYPVASQNLADFYNLVDVYLDAVFFPRLSEETFQQEGWHYELEADTAPLEYKGVVFNEMKGAYSSPPSVLGRLNQQSLFPDTIYGHSSGGDPKAIPDLTYEAFREFHRRHYHPSNARFVFYGDDDPEKRLEILDGVLSQFERLPANSDIPLQPRFAEPRFVTDTYAAGTEDDPGRSSMVSVNWMLDLIPDQETDLALTVLEHALVGSAAAPLRKALTDSGLGEGLTPSGLGDDIKQPIFLVGLKGIRPEDAGKVEELILSTLTELADKGIDPLTVEAALNSLEFQLRENNTGSFPRGIALMFRAMRTWLHDGDPFEPLHFEAALASIRARIESGEPLFQTLIRTQLLDNPHRTTVLLNPDPEKGAREAEEERGRLAAVASGLDTEGRTRIAEATRRLRALQQAADPPEALATIPSLTVADLPRQNKPIPVEETEIAGTRVLVHELPTSGIAYLDLGFDLHVLPPELLPYVPLFSRALLQTGTAKEDFVSLTQRIGRSTGGIGPVRIVASHSEAKEAAAWLVIRGKAVPGKLEEMLAIIDDVVKTARLDNRQRFQQMLLEEKAGFEGRIAGIGNGLVNMRLRAGMNEADWANEQMAGVSYLFFLRRLIKEVEEDWPSVEAKLVRIRDLVFTRTGMIGNVTAEPEGIAALRPELERFLRGLPATTAGRQDWRLGEPLSEGLTFPGQVNYVAKGGDIYRLGYRRTGATSVVLRHLNTTYLWDKVRVEGGAYGGSSAFDVFSGGFTFLSYRDPNLLETLAAYDGAGAFLAAGIGPDDLKRSIIGAIGAIDTYRLPDAKGFTSLVWHLIGSTDEDRQKRREEALEASEADFRALGEVLSELARVGRVVVLGSDPAIREANAEMGGFLEVTKVL